MAKKSEEELAAEQKVKDEAAAEAKRKASAFTVGCSALTTLRGIVEKGQEVTVADFANPESYDKHVAAGNIVKG